MQSMQLVIKPVQSYSGNHSCRMPFFGTCCTDMTPDLSVTKHRTWCNMQNVNTTAVRT